MYCCPECFNDKWLQHYIIDNGEEGYCEICDEERDKCIETEELSELFQPIIDLYTPVDDFYPIEIIKDMGSGDFIWDKLTYDWEIFDDPEKGKRIITDMFPYRAYEKDNDPKVYLDSWYDIKSDYYGTTDEPAREMISKWNIFCNEIKYKNRFFPWNPLDDDDIYPLLNVYDYSLENNDILYRARLSNGVQIEPSQMGKPPKEKSINGRANPIGIPCLYLSTNENTAIYEVRPDIHDELVVGRFCVNQKLKLMDLRKDTRISPFKYGKEIKNHIQYLKFLKILGEELSKPINKQASKLEYLSTQYLSEFIKNLGFDGLLYSSSVCDGDNVALFNDSKDVINCFEINQYQITETDLKYNYTKIVYLQSKITNVINATSSINNDNAMGE